jgi:predicted nucleic acid-binding protein
MTIICTGRRNDDSAYCGPLMRREGITDALTGDHHFEQAGFVALLQ